MFDTVCTLPLPSELFAQATHPTSPFLALGLATGHVQIHRLPPSSSAAKSGCGTIETVWRTRRHKGSCRTLSFSPDGGFLFSAGTDGIVKAAATGTGQVVSKIAIPQHNSSPDPPTVLHALSPLSLLLATDSSALHIYDLRISANFVNSKPQQTHHPHDDYISSISPLPPTEKSTSGYSKQWVSTGATTIAVTDLRKGVLTQSEDLDEELLSCATVGGKMIVGGERGVLRIWKQGEWDREERAIVDRSGSIDILAEIPDEDKGAAGMSNGTIRFVDVRKRKVVSNEMSHDEVEGVVGLDFESEGRMISGGGLVVKVWARQSGGEDAQSDDDDEDTSEEHGVNGDGDGSGVDDTDVELEESSEEEEEEEEEEEVEEEEKNGKRRRKRRRNKGKINGGVEHIMAFKGLD